MVAVCSQIISLHSCISFVGFQLRPWIWSLHNSPWWRWAVLLLHLPLKWWWRNWLLWPDCEWWWTDLHSCGGPQWQSWWLFPGCLQWTCSTCRRWGLKNNGLLFPSLGIVFCRMSVLCKVTSISNNNGPAQMPVTLCTLSMMGWDLLIDFFSHTQDLMFPSSCRRWGGAEVQERDWYLSPVRWRCAPLQWIHWI